MSNEENKEKSDLKNGQASYNKFIKYSATAFEMGAIIAIGTYGGMWLDNYFSFEKPILTIILSLFSVFASLYLVIKQVKNDNK